MICKKVIVFLAVTSYADTPKTEALLPAFEIGNWFGNRKFDAAMRKSVVLLVSIESLQSNDHSTMPGKYSLFCQSKSKADEI